MSNHDAIPIWVATELYPDAEDESIGIAGVFPVVRLGDLRVAIAQMIQDENESEVMSGYSGSGCVVLKMLLARLVEKP